MFRHSRALIFALVLPAAWWAAGQEAQFQQARQVGVLGAIPSVRREAALQSEVQPAGGLDPESFGVQMLLKEQERPTYFHAFSQISTLVTNNAALSHVDPRPDAFLVATLGLEYRRAISRHWQVEASVQAAMFRYNKYRVLDFNSIDGGAGLTYRLEQLGGIDFFARYNYAVLTGTHSADPLLQNQSVIAGAQKAFVFNPAFGAYFGAAAQTAWADPVTEQRSELGGFVGARLQATRHLEADTLFRYAYIPYRKNERRDHNQTLSLNVRYRFTPWVSLSASGFAGWNQSNIDAFSYDDLKGGGGLTLDVRF